ncbi:hypothetical protein GALL_529140 [mine drainage metagenome]|uniref:Uncharacterized protein n=1 Tax=mine drainage metagenome TaxID=410659 RepID=A0A1J5PCI1_9ZZZZ
MKAPCTTFGIMNTPFDFFSIVSKRLSALIFRTVCVASFTNCRALLLALLFAVERLGLVACAMAGPADTKPPIAIAAVVKTNALFISSSCVGHRANEQAS